ncbi:MAG: chaperone NapD [Leptospiraceae bacterium]|nr:chaperone NapD [Leptospiraceae bacterium]MCP5499858.1 chaperone NapD [Leptospiraceae bacterium]
MPVSSLIVEVVPGKEEEVIQSLLHIRGVSVENVENSHLVVVTDTSTLEEDTEVTEKISSVKDVVLTNIVFTNIEDTFIDESGEFSYE